MATHSQTQCSFWIKDGKKCINTRRGSSGYCSLHNRYKNGSVAQDRPDECVVCTEPFGHDNPLIPCGHWVHLSCIYKSGKGECPICREKLDLTEEQKANIVYNVPLSSDPFYSAAFSIPQDTIPLSTFFNHELDIPWAHVPFTNNRIHFSFARPEPVHTNGGWWPPSPPPDQPSPATSSAGGVTGATGASTLPEPAHGAGNPPDEQAMNEFMYGFWNALFADVIRPSARNNHLGFPRFGAFWPPPGFQNTHNLLPPNQGPNDPRPPTRELVTGPTGPQGPTGPSLGVQAPQPRTNNPVEPTDPRPPESSQQPPQTNPQGQRAFQLGSQGREDLRRFFMAQFWPRM